MTLIQIAHYTDEEVKSYYDSLSPEEKNQVTVLAEYDLDQNWEKWEQVRERLPGQRYLFFKRDMTSDKKISNIYLIDTFQTATVIQGAYTSFRNVVGFDFDPIQVVYEIQDPTSEFWNKVLNHSALHGILFGFGAKNSWAFHWKYWNETPCLKDFPAAFSDSSLDSVVSISNFPIPAFIVFNDWDIVETYKQEREAIRMLYKGQDFIDLTLKRLTE